MEKTIFAGNLQLELFRATVANADTGSLKSLHRYVFGPHAGKICLHPNAWISQSMAFKCLKIDSIIEVGNGEFGDYKTYFG